MPRYSFSCECGNRFETIKKMSDNTSKAKCKCGKIAKRVYTAPALVTDTSFCMTGKRDGRFNNVTIEGRKHWKQLVESKGYTELSDSQFKKD